ncbi:unnamed protein product, partial [Meganyctiphanes norvegica]
MAASEKRLSKRNSFCGDPLGQTFKKWLFWKKLLKPVYSHHITSKKECFEDTPMNKKVHLPKNLNIQPHSGGAISLQCCILQMCAHMKKLLWALKLTLMNAGKGVKLDLDLVQSEWEETSGPHHIRTLAEHYGIFKDLFGKAYFVPRVILNINFNFDEETVSPVYRGNVIKPKEASNEPSVEFSSSPDDLWTLILTNPDGNLKDSSKQCLHWFMTKEFCRQITTKLHDVLDFVLTFLSNRVGFPNLIQLNLRENKPLDF